MIELNGVRIWAIVCGDRRESAPRKLPCGVIVSHPTPEQRAQVPADFPACFELPNRPGLFVPFSGVFRLATGELAAVYGAVVEPIG